MLSCDIISHMSKEITDYQWVLDNFDWSCEPEIELLDGSITLYYGLHEWEYTSFVQFKHNTVQAYRPHFSNNFRALFLSQEI